MGRIPEKRAAGFRQRVFHKVFRPYSPSFVSVVLSMNACAHPLFFRSIKCRIACICTVFFAVVILSQPAAGENAGTSPGDLATGPARDFPRIDPRFVREDPSVQEKNGSWRLYYTFDQYLYGTDNGSGEGLGLFGRFGASDADSNPVHYFFSRRVGGKDVTPDRTPESFGCGYSFLPGSFLGAEQGFEACYSIAVTPWMKLSPDVQLVRPAEKQMVNGGGIPPPMSDRSILAAAIVGLRLQLIF